MSTRQILAPTFVFSAVLWCCAAVQGNAATAEVASPAAKPWSDTFTMTLQGKERTYVNYQGASYLLATTDDLTDPAFMDQKDVMVAAKLGRVDGTRATLYSLPKVEAHGPVELWRTRIDGDNLYLFGHTTNRANTIVFAVLATEIAPSDSDIVSGKLAGIAATDYPARLAVATWAKDMAAQQGNREFWLITADNIISQLIEDAAAQAETAKNTQLVLQAMTWCSDLLHDIPRAARIGSAAWIRAQGGAGAEEVARRMRRWDLEFYAGQWRPRSDALTQEFSDRFAALGWKDAEGYYKLGRWADANAEVLPRARELSYRCYQAGFRANSKHNGIRRELGMEAVSEVGAGGIAQGDFKDTVTSILIVNPQGWNRTDPIDGDVTWIDPASDTAYITARILRDAPGDFSSVWNTQLSTLQSRSGFVNLAEEKETSTQGDARHIRYSYQEGRYKRFADMIVVQNPGSHYAVRLDASAADSEQESVRKQLTTTFQKLAIPSTARVPAAGDAKPAPGQPNKGAKTEPTPMSGERNGEKNSEKAAPSAEQRAMRGDY